MLLEVGEHVKVIGNSDNDHYFKIGEIGIVVEISKKYKDCVWVKSHENRNKQCIHFKDLEKLDLP